MHQLFSTAQVHPRDRFDLWHEVACRNLVGHDSRPTSRPGFSAEISAATLADLHLISFHNSPMEVARTLPHIARATDDGVFLCRQLSGELAVEQEGRQIVLRAGEMAFLDPMLPYLGRFGAASMMLVLKLPRRKFEARSGRMRTIVARVIPSARGEGGLLSAVLAALPSCLDDRITPAAEEMFAQQIIDLAGLAAVRVLGETEYSDAPSVPATYLNVCAAIEARLSDPSTNSRTIAAAAGVSVRYANAVLARRHTSTMRLLQERRLERCRRALEDPQQSSRTLTDIACAWGFTDMTHFARRFRARYGVLPSEYRRLRNGQTRPS